MKQAKRFLCALLALMLCVGTASAGAFPDVDDTADYAEAVDYLADIGIFTGDENGNFNPDKTVTRAEMAVIVCKMLGETDDLTRSDTFTDVPYDHWANPYIARAAELGFISGYGDGKFGPGDQVLYEQAVTMVIRAIGLEDEAQEYGGYPNGYLSVAENYEITKSVYANVGTELSRAKVAIILYNISF